MSKTFYHIYATPKKGESIESIEKKLDLAIDWFKYSKSVWIVYSTSDVSKWMKRLKPLVEPDGRLFICELNISNRNGWMNKSFWDWLKDKKR